ncbi:RNA polymerase sigma factor RpoH [Motilimonas sp. 1_MG-2023]|uniref:RNA polymerase sigma factor RpoH n=1 Tax=Motilimonas sp. 1_MG-2023 TaxID=3062672 RepID=UPI0026E16167|nr:RNA polymerase sigma factor RpoH [Motilimonas sp. 1_MG-2023]MDO6526111.1 RNA polymerase sigma factor RpoH [Motilimonas sp. 1_MG-2023]
MYQLANTCPLADLQAYINQVNRLPILSAEQERELAEKLSKEQDLEAAKALIMSNLRFVVMIARGYQGYGLPQADLVQEGNIGLMKAVKRFDPEMGVRLMSFAVYWIKAEIHEYVFRNWRIIKSVTTKAQKKLFFNLRKFKRDLHWFSADEVEEVADTLNVTPAQVREMEMRLSSQDVSLLLSDDDEEDRYLGIPESSLPAADASPELQLLNLDQHQQGQDKLYQKLAQLDDRSRDIIEARWLSENKATLHELAEKYGVSYERIRQLEGQAIGKLRAHILA